MWKILLGGTDRRPLVAWQTLCQLKTLGGMGFKNLALWSKAMITKHVWEISCKKDAL